MLTEISFGEWEGKTAAEIKAIDPVLFDDFHRAPVKDRPPGAESLEVFSKCITGSLSVRYKRMPGKKDFTDYTHWDFANNSNPCFISSTKKSPIDSLPLCRHVTSLCNTRAEEG